MASCERRLWGHFRRFMDLAATRPSLLVDCVRVVELQVRRAFICVPCARVLVCFCVRARAAPHPT